MSTTGVHVDRLERLDLELEPGDPEHGDAVQAQWIRPVGRSRREDAGRKGGSRRHAGALSGDVAPRFVQPGDHEDLVADRDSLERVCKRQLQGD